uniref:Large ribosomal subunit protein uL22c n=1 Tax=Alnus alnobetula subsp. alnobetula TaxID=492571 RepID=A0A7T7BXQ3_ALNAN|nr:ribosomal protein L22 [Alnus alnobetula subsp. alnobetula]QQK56543.1 ribosomal protein L22 [Alnus alnobetula subsp. alnobetula]QQK56629.1 ribosomal protein L22 [Alnus alnobetula subsp. alnobetula]QQK56715.1 ribosomal protein L22 [Alnus alnobetula subsp. alnobetula]
MIKKRKRNPYTEGCPLSKHIRMYTNKARKEIDQIRGRSYEETLMVLELMPYRACYPLFKLVYSAAANAIHNMGLNEASLIISKVEVNEGTTVKKLKPRARGRIYPIKRPTCHITIVLKDISVNEQYYKRSKYDILCLKNSGWINKNKYTDMTCHDIYSMGGLWDKK